VTRFKGLSGIAFCVFLAGCDRASLMDRFTPPADESLARSYVDLLRQEKFDQIERDFDPSVVDANTRDALVKMAELFPAGKPESVKAVGVNIYRGPEYFSTSITLEYQFPKKWLLAHVKTQMKRSVVTVVAFNVTTIPDSLEHINRFTLLGKSAYQYLLLMGALCSLLFSVYVFVLCMRTRSGIAKWLWMLFILVGIGRLAINWTTNVFTFTTMALQIPCVGVQGSPYGPKTLVVYLPVGALLFLDNRWRRKVAGKLIEPVQRSERLATD
jgi:hypothetical protein